MKIKTHISAIYRAEVTIPDDVWRRVGSTSEYNQQSLTASIGAAASGQDAYADVIEWVEDPDRAVCEAFVKSWLEFLKKEEPLISRCNNCGGGESDGEHGCPFQEEINGDYTFQCNCCHNCTTHCVQDI